MKARRRMIERKQLCYCWSRHKLERIHSTPSTSCSTSAPPAAGTLWPSAHSSRARRPSALAEWSGAGWGPSGPVRLTPPRTSPPAETAVHHTEWTKPTRMEEGGSGYEARIPWWNIGTHQACPHHTSPPGGRCWTSSQLWAFFVSNT